MSVTLPVRRPLRLYQGDTRRIPIRVYTDRARTTAKDISGRTYASKVKDSAGATLLTATTDVTEAGEGLVWLIFAAADTAAVAASNLYVYDIQETDEDGDITTLVSGPCSVEGQVTT